MNESANVFNLYTFQSTMRNLGTIDCITGEKCDETFRKAENVLHDAENELNVSNNMLNVVRAVEAEKFALQLAADARMARAVVEEAAAISSGNPIAIAAASMEVATATEELTRTTEEYRKAVEHRERIEHRVELAQKCVNIAQEMIETLRMRFSYSRTLVSEKIREGNFRLQNAYTDLERYLSRISKVALAEISEFYGWKTEENKPVTPKEVHDRLNASKNVTNAILEYLYVTDPKFKFSVDRLVAQLKTPGNETSVETKIKKNIVGRLCEELVIRSFAPMGERVSTQGIYYLEDGTYTKADMILYGLKEPLILGKGEGMGAQKGGNLGIEVKSGKKEYIFAQSSHMEKQAKGHSMCDISCTVCSRDIKDLSPEKEKILRDRLKEAGSPMLGMLPHKSELDAECIEFVKAKVED
jgi:hypothetical protein